MTAGPKHQAASPPMKRDPETRTVTACDGHTHGSRWPANASLRTPVLPTTRARWR
jgi:hypothetical protein